MLDPCVPIWEQSTEAKNIIMKRENEKQKTAHGKHTQTLFTVFLPASAR